jgi:hypothetical protein
MPTIKSDTPTTASTPDCSVSASKTPVTSATKNSSKPGGASPPVRALRACPDAAIDPAAPTRPTILVTAPISIAAVAFGAS